MARTYDSIVPPGGLTSRSRSTGQPASPRGKVLVNSGAVGEVTNRDKISLIHTPLWKDASYTNPGTLWLGGGVLQPASTGGPIPYN